MINPKRILFLADINSIHIQRWVTNLANRGTNIALYSLSKKDCTWPDNINDFSYKCYGLQVDAVRSKNNFAKFKYFGAVSELRSYCKEVNPDIVHAHYASSYGMLAKRLGFPKTILSLWGSDVYEFPQRSLFHKLMFKRIVKWMPIVCSTSHDMAKEAKKYVKREYQITPFGIDIDLFKPTEEVNNILSFGTVKTLEPVYGIDRLIKLFEAFTREYELPVQLLIYGQGSSLGDLKMLVQKLDLNKKVQFKGFVQGQELVQAFQSLDVFIALSRSESFGVSVLEAQACGIPVLVSNVGGLPEVVESDSGFVIEGDDVEAGIKALKILSENSVRMKMGKAARLFVKENYEEAVCIEKLISIYDKL